MALALVQLLHAGPQELQLLVDVGANPFFRYRIGRQRTDRRGQRLAGTVYRSPVLRAQPGSPLQSAFPITIPRQTLGEDGRYLELISFASERGDGFARSELLDLAPLRRFASMQSHPTNPQPNIMSRPTTRRKKMDYREIGYAESMGWGAILNALPAILQAAGPIANAVGPLVGGLLGGSSSPTTAPAAAPSNAAPAAPTTLTPELIAALRDLINRLAPTSGTATAQSLGYSHAAAFNPAMLTQIAPLLQRVMSPETLNAIGDQPMKMMRAIGEAALKMDQQEMAHLERLNPGVDNPNTLPLLLSMSLRKHNYSRAKVAPALLAALPALMPVVEKLLSPETINAIGDQPMKLFKAIGDAALKMDQQEMEHLERLNPGVDDPNVLPLLLSMSIPTSTDVALRYRYSPALELTFANASTVTVGGVERVVYRADADMVIPLLVSRAAARGRAGRMTRAMIQLIVQDGSTFEVLMDKKFRIRDLPFDQVFDQVRLSAAETQGLPVGRDLKLEVNLLWLGKDGRKTFGTFKNHVVRRAYTYQFAGAGAAAGKEIPLNDLAQHRPFWHQVWQGGFSESKRWEIDFEMKYYYRAAGPGQGSALNDTRYRILRDNADVDDPRPRRREVSGQLKSGFLLGIDELEKLLPSLGLPALPEGMLRALRGAELSEVFDLVARQSVSFKGKAGQTATLWSYPEVTPRELAFARLRNPNAYGQYTSETEEKGVFPIPSSLHLIGTISQ